MKQTLTATAAGAALVDVAVVALAVWGLRAAFRWFRNSPSPMRGSQKRTV